jgi:subtilisin family serine protease
MKRLRYKITGLLLLLMALGGAYGQTNSEYFYYYNGAKFMLQADYKTIAISIEGEDAARAVAATVSNVQQKAAAPLEDHTRGTLVAIDNSAISRKGLKTFYSELVSTIPASRQDYPAQIASLRRLPGVMMASPCFISSDGRQRMGLSNNFYVKLKSPGDADLLYDEAKKLGIEVMGHNEYMPLWFTLSCGRATRLNALQAANLLYETGLFESTEPAFMYHDLQATADPLYNDQWGLRNTGQWGASGIGIDIKVEQAWTITTGSPTIRTAIFDHGFEMNHPDLAAVTFGTGYDATTNTTPSQVRGSHGTACAGITGAVANNNLGISGVAPGGRLMSVSINLLLSDPPQSLANGFNWAWQNGAAVISNSYGGYAPSTIIDDAITNTLNNGRGGLGTVVVFAAGNNNSNNILYPGGANPRVLVVGALSPCGQRKNPSSCDGETFWGSSYGSQLDVMAPGVKIATTDRQGTNGYVAGDYTLTFNGTSSACPSAAGVAALVLSANPSLTVQQVTDIIEQTTQKVRTDLYTYATTGGRPNGTWNLEMGYGLVNAYQAVLLASSSGCPANLTITATATGTDNRQASSSINALNLINTGATAVYHAGGEVLLSPGFSTNPGSVFRGYIEGCTGNFVARPANTDVITYNLRQTGEELSIQQAAKVLPGNLLVSPNPNRGLFRLDLGKNKNGLVQVVSPEGVVVAQQRFTNQPFLNFNITNRPGGVYLLRIITEQKTLTQKMIKE